MWQIGWHFKKEENRNVKNSRWIEKKRVQRWAADILEREKNPKRRFIVSDQERSHQKCARVYISIRSSSPMASGHKVDKQYNKVIKNYMEILAFFRFLFCLFLFAWLYRRLRPVLASGSLKAAGMPPSFDLVARPRQIDCDSTTIYFLHIAWSNERVKKKMKKKKLAFVILKKLKRKMLILFWFVFRLFAGSRH